MNENPGETPNPFDPNPEVGNSPDLTADLNTENTASDFSESAENQTASDFSEPAENLEAENISPSNSAEDINSAEAINSDSVESFTPDSKPAEPYIPAQEPEEPKSAEPETESAEPETKPVDETPSEHIVASATPTYATSPSFRGTPHARAGGEISARNRAVHTEQTPADIAYANAAKTAATNSEEKETQSTPDLEKTIESIADIKADQAIAAAKKGEKRKKSKKTGWIISAILLIVVAIVCAVAAVAVFNPFGGTDKVNAAIEKILNGETSKNIALDGSISYVTDSDDASITDASATFTSQFSLEKKISEVEASLSLTTNNNLAATLDIDATTTDGKNVYVRLNDLAESLTTMVCSYTGYDEDDCPEIDWDYIATSGQLGVLSTLGTIITTADSEWIKLPYTLDDITSNASLDSDTECLVNLFEDLNTAELRTAYLDNPFITSSTDDLRITAKSGTLYKLGYDESKLQGFMNAVENTTAVKTYESCVGETNGESTVSAIEDEFDGSLTIYAEVDDDNNFTRFYLNGTTNDEDSIKLDVSVSYPTMITVSSPATSIDFSEISDALSTFFGN